MPAAEVAAAGTAAAPGQLTLPAPSGRYPVGAVDLHLRDAKRTDPWLPSPQPRELMVTLWYPATHASRYPAAPWLQSVAAAHFLSNWQLSPSTVTLPATAGHAGAPVDHKAGKLPVVLYSTGRGSDRATGTALAEDLASRGYLVVTLDDTHDDGEVQFPGGRLETSTMPPTTPATHVFSARVADTRFVIDQLTAITHGHNPDVDHASLPHGLSDAIDTTRIGMFGASLGGGEVPAAMQADSRIDAGADLDGQFFGPETTKDLNRPFLLFSSEKHNLNTDSSWATFWKHLHGERYDLKLLGAQHLSFLDYEALISQAPSAFKASAAQLVQTLGTIAPDRAIEIQRVYLADFFDKALRHTRSPLLDGPSSRYPEVAFPASPHRQPPVPVALYRCNNPGNSDHLTTTTVTAANTGCEGYPSLDGRLGHIPARQTAGTVPLYRCYNPATGDHLDTTNSTCEGYPNKDGRLGYIYTTQIPGTFPLYRCYNPALHNHHLTTSDPKCEGYPNLDGRLGYALP
ncbi:hydrolase [Streptomyces sp. NPDC059680]|uniref:alpha/beta hydrolase n=1 Tax=Streptomyces sp. NPDC059680 TaxID=3346904 RepID=UPI0036A71FC3